MSSRRQMLEFLSLSKLPSAYQEVEYIESTGTQYIDTGFTPDQDTKVIFNFSVSQFFNEANAGLYGGRIAYNENNYSAVIGGTSGIYNTLFCGYGTQSNSTNTQLLTNTKYNLIQDKNNMYLDNNLILTATQQTFTSPSMYLFCVNQNNNTNFNSYIKLYSFKLYDNGTIVRNFVPCYRKSDDVIGLYDLVNGVFYTNAGSGAFTKGGNV